MAALTTVASCSLASSCALGITQLRYEHILGRQHQHAPRQRAVEIEHLNQWTPPRNRTLALRLLDISHWTLSHLCQLLCSILLAVAAALLAPASCCCSTLQLGRIRLSAIARCLLQHGSFWCPCVRCLCVRPNASQATCTAVAETQQRVATPAAADLHGCAGHCWPASSCLQPAHQPCRSASPVRHCFDAYPAEPWADKLTVYRCWTHCTRGVFTKAELVPV